MRILVTGSNGQVGKAIQRLSKGTSYEFLFTSKDSLNIADTSQVDDVILGFKPKIIINAAAYTAVDKAEENKSICESINALALLYITSTNNKLEHPAFIIHISTDYVYNPSHSNIMDEQEPTNPQNVYAVSKLKGEKLLQSNSENFIVLRTSWVYDETGHNFVNTMDRLGGQKEMLNVVSDQVGSPTYAGDIAKIIFDCIKAQIENSKIFEKEKIFNFSNEGFTNWAEFAEEIMRIQNHSCIINPIPTEDYPTPAKRPLNSRMDKQLIKNILGIEIPHWKESLVKCLANKVEN